MITGDVYKRQTQGYGGDITFTLGIRNDGTVNGYEILSISETAGLGMKAKEDAFKQQFSGKKVDSFAYTKTGASCLLYTSSKANCQGSRCYGCDWRQAQLQYTEAI